MRSDSSCGSDPQAEEQAGVQQHSPLVRTRYTQALQKMSGETRGRPGLSVLITRNRPSWWWSVKTAFMWNRVSCLMAPSLLESVNRRKHYTQTRDESRTQCLLWSLRKPKDRVCAISGSGASCDPVIAHLLLLLLRVPTWNRRSVAGVRAGFVLTNTRDKAVNDFVISLHQQH